MTARLRVVLLAAILLAGCSTVQTPGGAAPHSGWADVLLPGKRATSYRADVKEGRSSVMAVADGSASLLRRSLRVPPSQLGSVEFSWWIGSLIDGATVQHPETDDAPVRVMLAFDGDAGRLSARNQAMFELARLAMGEPPPYATLMYVWDAEAALESVVVSRRSDRVRKIVVERGAAHLGTWRSYKRDIVADFRRAFGEEPGDLIGVALMTDGDNTQSVVEAWYGEVQLR
jgi:hypothetical protein